MLTVLFLHFFFFFIGSVGVGGSFFLLVGGSVGLRVGGFLDILGGFLDIRIGIADPLAELFFRRT